MRTFQQQIGLVRHSGTAGAVFPVWLRSHVPHKDGGGVALGCQDIRVLMARGYPVDLHGGEVASTEDKERWAEEFS